MTVTLPIRAVSVANLREHWSVRAQRAKEHRRTACWLLGIAAVRPDLPCVVTLTRIAPRPLDDDNLRGACKALRDGIADWLGVDDRDPRVEWRYGQAKGKPKEYAVRVDIEKGRYIVTTEGDVFHSRHLTEAAARAVAEEVGGSWWHTITIPNGTKVEVAEANSIKEAG